MLIQFSLASLLIGASVSLPLQTRDVENKDPFGMFTTSSDNVEARDVESAENKDPFGMFTTSSDNIEGRDVESAENKDPFGMFVSLNDMRSKM